MRSDLVWLVVGWWWWFRSIRCVGDTVRRFAVVAARWLREHAPHERPRVRFVQSFSHIWPTNDEGGGGGGGGGGGEELARQTAERATSATGLPLPVSSRRCAAHESLRRMEIPCMNGCHELLVIQEGVRQALDVVRGTGPRPRPDIGMR